MGRGEALSTELGVCSWSTWVLLLLGARLISFEERAMLISFSESPPVVSAVRSFSVGDKMVLLSALLVFFATFLEGGTTIASGGVLLA